MKKYYECIDALVFTVELLRVIVISLVRMKTMTEISGAHYVGKFDNN